MLSNFLNRLTHLIKLIQSTSSIGSISLIATLLFTNSTLAFQTTEDLFAPNLYPKDQLYTKIQILDNFKQKFQDLGGTLPIANPTTIAQGAADRIIQPPTMPISAIYCGFRE